MVEALNAFSSVVATPSVILNVLNAVTTYIDGVELTESEAGALLDRASFFSSYVVRDYGCVPGLVAADVESVDTGARNLARAAAREYAQFAVCNGNAFGSTYLDYQPHVVNSISSQATLLGDDILVPDNYLSAVTTTQQPGGCTPILAARRYINSVSVGEENGEHLLEGVILYGVVVSNALDDSPLPFFEGGASLAATLPPLADLGDLPRTPTCAVYNGSAFLPFQTTNNASELTCVWDSDTDGAAGGEDVSVVLVYPCAASYEPSGMECTSSADLTGGDGSASTELEEDGSLSGEEIIGVIVGISMSFIIYGTYRVEKIRHSRMKVKGITAPGKGRHQTRTHDEEMRVLAANGRGVKEVW